MRAYGAHPRKHAAALHAECIKWAIHTVGEVQAARQTHAVRLYKGRRQHAAKGIRCTDATTESGDQRSVTSSYVVLGVPDHHKQVSTCEQISSWEVKCGGGTCGSRRLRRPADGQNGVFLRAGRRSSRHAQISASPVILESWSLGLSTEGRIIAGDGRRVVLSPNAACA